MYRTNTREQRLPSWVGFENHSGKTYLGEDVAPLGMMIKGYGNNGEDQTEGARYNNVFATYSHGSCCRRSRAVRLHPADRARPPLRQDRAVRTAQRYS